MISVVMPAYNAEKHIGEAIESLLQQTYRGFELLILDDGSTDDTPQIIEEYAGRDPRIRVERQENQGVSAASNRLTKLAQYEWIARLDADDVALPRRLELQLAAVAAYPDVVAWGGAVHHINEAGRVLGLGRCGPTSVQVFHQRRASGEVICVYHPTALLRRDVVNKAGGYDTRLCVGEDLDLFDRMGEYGPIVALEEPVALYRIHSTSASMNGFLVQREIMRVVEARARARAEGRALLDLDAFRDARRRQGRVRRLIEGFDDRSRFHYRRSGVRLGEGRRAGGPKALLTLGTSTALAATSQTCGSGLRAAARTPAATSAPSRAVEPSER